MQPYKTLLLFVFTLFSYSLPAQTCLNSQAATTLEINGVRALLLVGGDLWWDGTNAGYAVTAASNSPDLNPVDAIYAGGLWMGGMDPGGNIKLAAARFGRTRGQLDYQAGPLTEEGVVVPGGCAPWDRFFEVDREDVQRFLSSFDPDNPNPALIPPNIAGWPGVGNPLFAATRGFELPERSAPLAPFVDVDGDELYNPLMGDYPAFCGQTAKWCVFNDAGVHRDSDVPSNLQMEIHLLAYAYTAPINNPLHRTTFYDYTLINRSAETISDFHAGHWIDSDLGCPSNDRMNSVPERNLFYVYNDLDFEPESCGGIPGYGDTRPVNVFQVLRSTPADRAPGDTSLLYAVGNIYTANVPSQLTSPRTAQQYYNYLRGLTRDGAPLTRAGRGYNEGGDTTRYAFDGGPDVNGQPWLYCEQSLASVDLRNVYSVGPYDLDPGERAAFTLGITTLFGIDYPLQCPNAPDIFTATDLVRQAYEEDCEALRTVSVRPASATAAGVRVYPNPSRGSIRFEPAAGMSFERLALRDVNGRQVLRLSGDAATATVNLSGHALPPGTYFYELLTDRGRTLTGRIVLLP